VSGARRSEVQAVRADSFLWKEQVIKLVVFRMLTFSQDAVSRFLELGVSFLILRVFGCEVGRNDEGSLLCPFAGVEVLFAASRAS